MATKSIVIATLVFNVALSAYIFFGVRHLRQYPLLLGSIGALIPIPFTVFIIFTAMKTNKEFEKVREEELKLHPELCSAADRAGMIQEYRSKTTLLGLPLIHFRKGRVPGQPHEPAVGWIAIGDKAFGILFAAGGVAVGGIAMGGLCLGLIGLGGAALGVVAFGGLAVGGLAYGGVAIGMLAIGGIAGGYIAAEGGLAIAQQFALGGRAWAIHANDPVAHQFFRNLKWFDMTRPEVRRTMTLISWLPFLLIFLHARKLRRKQLRQP